ncbi:MAG: glycosyltransferase [Actinomycetota bacterium]
MNVSVALCTHNGGEHVEEQVWSILHQTVRPAQIVLSDDASADETVAMVRSIMASPEARGITLTVLENPVPLGVTANFEQAVRACTSELIALCDQDDSWHPERLSRAIAQFETRPSLDLLFTNARLVDDVGDPLDGTLFAVLEVGERELRQVSSGDGLGLFIRRNVATGATVTFRRRLLDAALPFAPSWVHDGWLATLAAAIGEIDALDENLIDYRQHASNQIGVAYPTLRRKVARTLAARGDRNARIAAMFEQLAGRILAVAPDDAALIAAVSAKADFEARREALPSFILARIMPIVRMAARGLYSRFASQGRIDVIRDLLQPHR